MNFSTVPPKRSISRFRRGVVRAQRGTDVFGVGLVGARREADEVDEEHGDDLAFLAGRRWRRATSPQAMQNRARSGFSSPQFGQVTTRAV